MKLPLITLLFSLSPAVWAGVTIEGYSTELLVTYRETLKSVIGFVSPPGLGSYGCSATFVEKNILLTAAHCVEPTDAGHGLKSSGLKKGDVITFTNGEKAKVTGTRVQEAADSLNADLAFIAVEPITQRAHAFLNSVPSIPIRSIQSTSNNEPLHAKILFAGYGATDSKNKTFGTLNAGLNQWARSDYSPLPTKIAEQNEKLFSKSLKSEQLVSLGKRTALSIQKFSAGETFSRMQNLRWQTLEEQTQIDPQSAIPLSGDSGGPAVAFDLNNKPFLVGVASTTGGSTSWHEVLLTATDASGKKIERKISGSPDQALQGITLVIEVRNFATQLADAGWVNANGFLLKNIQVEMKKTIYATASFASVFTEKNREFLVKSLNELSLLRK